MIQLEKIINKESKSFIIGNILCPKSYKTQSMMQNEACTFFGYSTQTSFRNDYWIFASNNIGHFFEENKPLFQLVEGNKETGYKLKKEYEYIQNVCNEVLLYTALTGISMNDIFSKDISSIKVFNILNALNEGITKNNEICKKYMIHDILANLERLKKIGFIHYDSFQTNEFKWNNEKKIEDINVLKTHIYQAFEDEKESTRQNAFNISKILMVRKDYFLHHKEIRSIIHNETNSNPNLTDILKTIRKLIDNNYIESKHFLSKEKKTHISLTKAGFGFYNFFQKMKKINNNYNNNNNNNDILTIPNDYIIKAVNIYNDESRNQKYEKNKRIDNLLEIIKENPGITLKTIKEKTNLPNTTISRYIKKIQETIYVTGSNKSRLDPLKFYYNKDK